MVIKQIHELILLRLGIEMLINDLPKSQEHVFKDLRNIAGDLVPNNFEHIFIDQIFDLKEKLEDSISKNTPDDLQRIFDLINERQL